MKIHVISRVKQKDCETTTAACDFINQGHTPTDCDCVMSIPSLTLWYYGCFELVLFAVGVHRVVVVKMRLITPNTDRGKQQKEKKKSLFCEIQKHKGKRNNNGRQDAASSLFNNCGGFTGDNYLRLRLHAPASGSTSGLKMCAGGGWPLREKIWEQHTRLPQGFSWPGKVIYRR